MWTAKIIKPLKANGRIAITVELSDGVETFREEFSSTTKVDMVWLKHQIRTRIEAFQDAYAFADSLVSDQPIDLTPPSAPTTAEQELQDFLKDYGRWHSIKRAIDAGILTGSEPKVVELKDKVKAAFKPAYLPHI